MDRARRLLRFAPAASFLSFKLALVLLLLPLAACRSTSERAVRQVVIDAEQAAQDVFDGKADAPTVEVYFARPEEGANPLGMTNTLNTFSSIVSDQTTGITHVQLTNFQITDVQVDEGKGQARVTYQVDVELMDNGQVGKATVTQDLALLRTPARGWRINGGDKAQLSNAEGALAQ
jgi:hypothetical protein